MELLSSLLSEQRVSESPGENVVEEDPHLDGESDVGARVAVDGNVRLGAELEVRRLPQPPGIDRARRDAAAGAVLRGLQVELYQQDHVAERVRQPDVLYILLQVREAVFQGESPFQEVARRAADREG